jgi:acetyl-CoA carboxylase biotin carboxyl carrier protein
MQIADVQQLSAWLAATDIDLLELHGPGEHLCLRRDGARVEVVPGDAVQDGPESRAVASAASPGVFLHGHPLRGETLASPGTVARAGQVLGLLQIGVLLLPVTAPAEGVVQAMLVAQGVTVGYGAPLVELRLLLRHT